MAALLLAVLGTATSAIVVELKPSGGDDTAAIQKAADAGGGGAFQRHLPTHQARTVGASQSVLLSAQCLRRLEWSVLKNDSPVEYFVDHQA